MVIIKKVAMSHILLQVSSSVMIVRRSEELRSLKRMVHPNKSSFSCYFLVHKGFWTWRGDNEPMDNWTSFYRRRVLSTLWPLHSTKKCGIRMEHIDQLYLKYPSKKNKILIDQKKRWEKKEGKKKELVSPIFFRTWSLLPRMMMTCSASAFWESRKKRDR